MLVKDLDTINLEQGRKCRLSRTERAQFKGVAFIIKCQNQLFFLTEEEWNQVYPNNKPAGLQKAATRKLNRLIGLKKIFSVRIGSRGGLSVSPSMRKKKGVR